MKIHKFKPIKRKDTLLFKLLIAVAALHAVALLILGGIVISEVILEPESTFEAPPPPEKVEKKQKFQYKPQQQKQASSNKLVKRIQIPQAKVSNIPTTNIALPSSDLAGTSLRGGAAPKGFGDLNITMTSVNLRGIEGKTEKIVIAIDASRYMMTDEKGALNTYNVIKKDIKDLVNKLPSTVLFNVIAFCIPEKKGFLINLLSPTGLIPASQENKAKLAAWIDPINSDLSDLDRLKSNYKLRLPFLPQAPDASAKTQGGYDRDIARMYIAYQAALEQGADTVFILSANWTPPARIKKEWTEADTKAYQAKVAKARAEFDANVKEAQANVSAEDKAAKAEKTKEQQAARAKAKAEANKKAKDWIKAENEKRLKAGQSLFTGTIDQVIKQEGFEKKVAVSRGPIFRPPAQENESYTGAEIVKYYRELIKKDKGTELPTVNMILFKGKKENIDAQAKSAESWVKLHKGKIKVLVGTSL